MNVQYWTVSFSTVDKDYMVNFSNYSDFRRCLAYLADRDDIINSHETHHTVICPSFSEFFDEVELFGIDRHDFPF